MFTYCLTTFDNPYDPFDQFNEWYNFDMNHGYSTCSYLARVAHTSPQLTDYENSLEIERAIDDIVFNDAFNMYKKVKKKVNDLV